MRIYSNNDWKIDQREIKVTINMPYNSRVLVEPMHSHEFMELSYVLAGEAVQIINGVTCPVRKGNIILMRPGDSHTFRMEAGFEMLNCLFGSDIFQGLIEELEKTFHLSLSYVPNLVCLEGQDLLEANDYFQKIRREYEMGEAGSQLAIQNLLHLIFIRIVRHIQTAGDVPSSDLSSRILEYIDENLSAVDLPTIAAYFGYSPSYFSKYFKKLFGVGMTAYINSIKIHRAQDLITGSKGELTVEEICNRFGFKDRKHFCAIYKEYLGITPSAALTRQRNAVRRAARDKAEGY